MEPPFWTARAPSLRTFSWEIRSIGDTPWGVHEAELPAEGSQGWRSSRPEGGLHGSRGRSDRRFRWNLTPEDAPADRRRRGDRLDGSSTHEHAGARLRPGIPWLPRWGPALSGARRPLYRSGPLREPGLFLQPERDRRPPQRELLLHRADGLHEPGLPEQLRLPGWPGLPGHLLPQPQVLRGVQRGHRAWGRWDVEVRSTIASRKRALDPPPVNRGRVLFAFASGEPSLRDGAAVWSS